ncbi:MAG: hypothetical protein PHF86_00755 [Candidatus Nanoarchaeia archaeon]|nr:hypothetical protein [Candidatus Nanoarchaeia archaeon]
MSKENYDAFFNPGVEAPENPSGKSEEYSPTADKGKGGTYQSIIRFIPWWKDPKHGSIQDKWVSYLVDPITQRGRYIDCPSSIGKPSPLADIYWKLKKSESVQMQKLAQNFSRRHSYASLIQVIRDENNPELEGRIMVYRYGIKIWEKINAELKPVIGEPHDPFASLTGKAFALVITKVSGFNNYDQSKFVDKRIPVCIPDEKGKLIPINAQSDPKMVYEWVKGNSPDLSKYAYKEWDQEIFDYVNHVIVAVTGEGQVSNKYAGVVGKGSSPAVPETGGGITSSDISIENLDIDSMGSGIDIPELDIANISKSTGIAGNLDDIMKDM